MSDLEGYIKMYFDIDKNSKQEYFADVEIVKDRWCQIWKEGIYLNGLTVSKYFETLNKCNISLPKHDFSQELLNLSQKTIDEKSRKILEELNNEGTFGNFILETYGEWKQSEPICWLKVIDLPDSGIYVSKNLSTATQKMNNDYCKECWGKSSLFEELNSTYLAEFFNEFERFLLLPMVHRVDEKDDYQEFCAGELISIPTSEMMDKLLGAYIKDSCRDEPDRDEITKRRFWVLNDPSSVSEYADTYLAGTQHSEHKYYNDYPARLMIRIRKPSSEKLVFPKESSWVVEDKDDFVIDIPNHVECFAAAISMVNETTTYVLFIMRMTDFFSYEGECVASIKLDKTNVYRVPSVYLQTGRFYSFRLVAMQDSKYVAHDEIRRVYVLQNVFSTEKDLS